MDALFLIGYTLAPLEVIAVRLLLCVLSLLMDALFLIGYTFSSFGSYCCEIVAVCLSLVHLRMAWCGSEFRLENVFYLVVVSVA